MRRPLRVRALYTRYRHWGPYAGFHQVCRYLQSDQVSVAIRPVRDGSPLDYLYRTYISDKRTSWYSASDFSAELRLLPALLSDRADVIHYIDGEHGVGFLPELAKRSWASAVKIVGTYHQPPSLLPKLVGGRAVSHLDLALVMSPTQEPFFRDWLPQDRVHTFLHGVDTEFFRPGPFRETQDVFRCITVGHWLRDWNAIREAVDLLGHEPNTEFHVVTSRETGLERCANVKIHRDVSDETLRALYQAADVLLLPLTDSTANNSLLEGLACGLPVISTDLPSVAAYVGDGPARLLAENSGLMLARMITELRDDPRRRAEMGQLARERANELAWPRRAEALRGLYRSLCRR
jgi:glycosyltransferase involved in cell wall biosynthesis